MAKISGAKFNAARVVMSSFLFALFMGTFLLMLPVSSVSGDWTGFLTALFTAVSSVCVTGLVVVPTFAYWSIVGKIIILILIQIGGLGIICIATGILIVLGRRISIKERRLIQDSYNLDTGQGILRYVKFIFAGTFAFEGIGTILYAIRFIPQFGIKGLWYALFQSVSAFCNAGMDILGSKSLEPYAGDVYINIVTILLIVLGGIGFIVWWEVVDLFKKVKNKKVLVKKVPERMSLHTKIVLITTVILLVLGAVLIFAFEYSNQDTLGNLSFGGKALSSIFQSVTLRTAGFSTIGQQGFRGATLLVCCVLMFIGGSPMGTAGGVKTATIALLFLEIRSVVRGKDDVECCHRKVSRGSVRTALTVVVLAISLLLTAIVVLTFTEDLSLSEIVFEAFSAMGTVGLSMGITADLSIAGKIVIIVLMFFGRIGPMTAVMALAGRRRAYRKVRDLPEKRVIVG